MDKKELVYWFTGNEDVTVTEQEARQFIIEMSEQNGADTSEMSVDQYVQWLREEGVVTD